MQQSNLKNKVYLVTGANGRIGYALSKQLILFRAKVIMTDILIDKIKSEIENNEFKYFNDLEDIHTHIESRLHEIIGESAGRLHTARSRNDQIATDLRLWARHGIEDIQNLIQSLLSSLIHKAEENIDTIMPGFTHMQTAQPITFAHHLLAYFEMFNRDFSRLEDCKQRLNESPLGSGAIAGT